MALIEAKDLVVGWDNEPLSGKLNFEVNSGDYLAVIGQNGSGKSTLIKTLLGLTCPVSGLLELNGIERTEIGYLPQINPLNKDFPATVYEIALSGFLAKNDRKFFYSHEQKEKALDNLELLGIDDLKDECYKNLSGGQQQRVLLARALCATDKLLVLDEPVTGLDPSATYEMYGILHHLNHNLKVTVIMISHDLDAVDKYATKVLDMDKCMMFDEQQSSFETSSVASDKSESTKTYGGGDNR